MLFFGVSDLTSQVSLRAFHYRPTGDVYGYLFKPINYGEVGFVFPFIKKSPFRPGITFTYLKMSTRLDTFPIYGTLSGYNGTTVLSGKESYSKFDLLKIYVGGDWAFLNKEKFKLFCGIDLVVGSSKVAYYYEVNTQINFGYSGGGLITGLRGRLGAEYYMTDYISVFISATRSYFNITDGLNKMGASANDYGIGIRLDFLNLR